MERVGEQRVIRATRDGAINQDDNGSEIGCKMSSVSSLRTRVADNCVEIYRI